MGHGREVIRESDRALVGYVRDAGGELGHPDVYSARTLTAPTEEDLRR